jgi:hypothetical protein
MAEKLSLEGTLQFAGRGRESFAFLRLHLFGVHLFCSDSFSFLYFLLLSAFSLFLTSRVASSFSDCSKPITTTHHFRKTGQESGKAFAAMNWTLPGRRTDIRLVNKNVSDSIQRNNESDSNKTDESDPQPLKQEEPRISTVRGMTMDRREELENASDLIARTKSHIAVSLWKDDILRIRMPHGLSSSFSATSF